MQYKKQETKDRILACALEEFYEYGESNASIRRIAEKAEVAVGNIYNYFPSKEAIYKAIIDPIRENFDKLFFEAVNINVSKKGLEVITSVAVPYMVGHRKEIRLLLNSSDSKGRKQKEEIFDKTAQKLKLEIDKVRRHYNKPDISFEYAKALAKSFTYGVFECLFSREDSRIVAAMLKSYFRFFFTGIEKRI